MQKIKIFITLTCSLFLSLPSLQADDAYALSNYAEITTAALRGPLAALSHYNHGKYTKITKVLHGATDVVRLTNELFTLINHPNNINPSSCFWIIFDLANLHIDLFGKDAQASHDDLINLTTEQTEIINTLVKVSQTCLLPLTEGLTAFYRATQTEQTPQNALLRRQEQAFCSLSRAISVFLNHQNSKPAIALLLSALTETTLALGNYPRIDVAPVPAGAAEQNPVNNNNIDLENNLQQPQEQNNLDQANPQEPVEIDQQNQVVHNQEHIENQVENNNQEELILPDHIDNVLPIPNGDNHEQEIPIAENPANHPDDHIEIIHHDDHVHLVNNPLQNNVEAIVDQLVPQINIPVGDHQEHLPPLPNINVPEPVIIIPQGLNNANPEKEVIPEQPEEVNPVNDNIGVNNLQLNDLHVIIPGQLEQVEQLNNNHQEDQQPLQEIIDDQEQEVIDNQGDDQSEEEIIFYDTFDHFEDEEPPLNDDNQGQLEINNNAHVDDGEDAPAPRRRRKKRRKKQTPKEQRSFFDRLKFWKKKS